MGKISINTEVATSIVYELNKSCNILENDLSNKLNVSFEPILDLGLVSNSIKKIDEQIESIINVEKQIIDSISAHLVEVTNTENRLHNNLLNGYSGYANENYNNQNTQSVQNETNINVDDVEKGQTINVTQFDELITSFDEDKSKLLLKLIDIKKSDNTPFIDLFFNSEKSEELFTILKEILKGTAEFAELSIEDIKEVQKVLLNTVVKNEIDNIVLNTESILIAKEYLVNISKENNIEVADLIIDEAYRDILKKALINLYKKNTRDISLDLDMNKKFIEYVDLIAMNNKITAEELLNNRIELLL